MFLIILAIAVAGSWQAINVASKSGDIVEIALTISGSVTGLIGILSATYLWLHSRNLKFYLFVNRLKHRFLPSRSVTWDIQATWQAPHNESAIPEFQNWLMKRYNNHLSVIDERYLNKRNYVVDNRFHLESTCEPYADGANWLLRIYALSVNFSDSSDVLSDDIVPILNRYSGEIRPFNSGQNYNLKMEFKKGFNPFFGLYIQGIRSEEIKNFNIILAPQYYNRDENNQVVLTPTVLSITTHSLPAFQTMAQDYLSFSPRLSQRPS